jgi:hypothetical protein
MAERIAGCLHRHARDRVVQVAKAVGHLVAETRTPLLLSEEGRLSRWPRLLPALLGTLEATAGERSRVMAEFLEDFRPGAETRDNAFRSETWPSSDPRCAR